MSNFGNYNSGNSYGYGNNSYSEPQQATPVDDGDWDYTVDNDCDPYSAGSGFKILAPGVYNFVVKKVTRNISVKRNKLYGCKYYEIEFAIMDDSNHEMTTINEQVFFGPIARDNKMDWMSSKYLLGFGLKEPGKPGNVIDLEKAVGKSGKIFISATRKNETTGKTVYVSNPQEFEQRIRNGETMYNQISNFVK